MTESGENHEAPVRSEPSSDSAGLTQCHPPITVSLKEERGTTHRGCIINRVVGQAVEAELGASPKHEEVGERERRQVHQFKTIARRREQPVERTL